MRQHFEDEYWPIWQRFVLQGALDEERLLLSVVHAWQRCALLGLNPHASQELKQSKGAKAQISQDLSHLIVYFVGPLLGGVLGTLTYDFMTRARAATASKAAGDLQEASV